jgi:lysophospholipase L1-like esterase
MSSIDITTLGDSANTAARDARAMKTSLCTIAPCALVIGCGSNSKSAEPTTKPSAPLTALTVVALGDSDATGQGDPSGVGWVGRYGRLAQAGTGRHVDVKNLAREGKTSEELLADLKNNTETQTAVKNAQIVLLGIGGADMNAGDDAFAAGKCKAERCYAPVFTSFAKNFDAIAKQVRTLRGQAKTTLLAITFPNVLTGAEDVIPPFLKPIATRIGIYQAQSAKRAICRVMSSYDGSCVELLGAFNGPSGRQDAYKTGLLNHEDCCYASAKGQQLIAQLVYDKGVTGAR